MKLFLNIFLLILPVLTLAQVEDQFSDGNFTTNPVWSGTSEAFIVNSDLQLQTHASVAATAYLSTSHNLANLDNKEWSFYIKQTFAGSSSNFSRVYLSADNANLGLNPNGYYLQFGESLTTDAVRLFRRQGGVETQICAGTSGAIATALNAGIRVVRDEAGNWSLYIDYSGGTNYVFQSAGADLSVLPGTYMGFVCTYTASNASKFYFDNVYAGNEILDTEPPGLISASAINATNVELVFSETVNELTAETIANYSLAPANVIISATRDASNLALVYLLLQNPLSNGNANQVTISNVADMSGNTTVLTGTFSFLVAEIPVKGDVIINEFICDPSPAIGLPEIEYVEIYNKSSKYFNLNGWKIGDNASDGTLTNAWLLPGEHKILCGSSGTSLFPAAVSVISFPSLNNTGDDIVLKDNTGLILDKITYTDNWYQDAVKQEGGYSLELINPNDPCSNADNWKASNDASGGTPGIQNSVYDVSPDLQVPQVIQVLAAAPNSLEVIFSESLDSLSLIHAIYSFDPTLTVSGIVLPSQFPAMATYQFEEALTGSQVYHYTLEGIADCWGNQATMTGKFALNEIPFPGDLVVNELLFNPITGGSDFIEIRNNSDKMIDLYGLELANYDDDTISNFKQVPVHFVLASGEYALLTADTISQLQTYPSAIPGRFIRMELPAMNNDSGTVYLLRDQQILDKISYLEDWHFPLIDDTDGKSLERIDPKGQSNDPKNWHTAAESIGFATPGKVNSQYSPALHEGNFSFSSDTFSPDNDGNEDVLQINYSMNQVGMVANLTIYDDRGRLVKNLTKNELLGKEGSITWNGIAENSQKAHIGMYVLVFEAFQAEDGTLFTRKKAFALAGKL